MHSAKYKEIKKLESQIRKHKELYYLGKPQISDMAYDALEEKLRKLDAKNPVLSLVGSTVSSKDKIKHDSKMLSLDKTYSLDDFESWRKNHEVLSTFKIDGVSCSLIYQNGILVQAKTRGDGSFGEDITDKILWMDCIPQKIEGKISNFEVRGELFCSEVNFFHLSDAMVSLNLEKPTSQRNIVAGLIGRKDHIHLCKFIDFKSFDFICAQKLKKEYDKFVLLKELDFPIPEVLIHKSKESIIQVIEQAKNFMSEGDYQVDGLVFIYNDINLQEELGATSHHPRYKMAFKFSGASKVTKIEKIIWSVSRNGYLTPVAQVKPVELSGATISNVTLHNYGMVKQFELKEGDEIEIIRSGEVIPKFLSVVKSIKGNFSIPKNCPSCSGKVVIEDIRLVCNNANCSDQIKESILNFIQKIGIEDISFKRLEEMINKKLVKKVSDLYRLKVEDLLTLDKVKEKLADKFFESIQKSKEVDVKTFLSALGISGGAYNKCEKVVDAGYDTIDKLKKLTTEKLMEVESFAEKSSEEFLSSLDSKFSLIDDLVDLGFKFKTLKKGKLSGKRICITGELSIKRSEMERLIREEGGVIGSSISKDTDYLITNETNSDSSKFKKAKELGVNIISEKAFLKLV